MMMMMMSLKVLSSTKSLRFDFSFIFPYLGSFQWIISMNPHSMVLNFFLNSSSVNKNSNSEEENQSKWKSKKA